MEFDFDPVSAKSVSANVALFFDPSVTSPVNRGTLNQSEKRWVDRIVMMLRGAEAGKLTVREKVETVKDDLGADIDMEWDFEDPSEVPKSPRHLWTKEKEAVGKRTLARKGEKKVEVVCQSKSATTSSITLLPIIGSDGYLKPKQFVQLGEPKGELPQKGCFCDSTMEIAVGKSHIMGKETAKQFYKKVLFDGYVPPKLLLLLDSWPCFMNHAEIRAAAPPNCLLFILNIPPGGTSLCQPADLSFNHQLKGIQKRLKSVIMARKLDYKVSQRDKLLKFVAQLHFCMGADRFKPFIQYGFFKGGFIKNRPPRFVGPKEFIFGKGSMAPCSICSSRGCSICPRCEKTFCFNCFWVNLHRC